MTEASLPAAAFAEPEAASGQGRQRQNHPWKLLLEALHHSRRLQAKRILGQYAALIATPGQHAASDVTDPERN